MKMAESKQTTGQSSQERVVILLSEDVLVEILARLPVKSLMRFKCVCKSWYSFISDPAFIHKHFLHYTNKPDNSCQLLVVSESRQFYGYAFSLVSSRVDTFSEQLARCGIPAKLGTTLLKDFVGTDYEFFAYKCHGFGIVCFRNPVNDNLALWNPATREFRILPELLEPICISPYTREYYPPYIYCGLGYDSVSNDYKLVHFGYRRLYNGSHYEEEPVALYSFNTNSWKILDVKFIGWPWPDCQTAAYINGLPWWLALESSKFHDSMAEGYDFIASFDLNVEMFRYYQLPESCRAICISYYSLVQLYSYVALAICPENFEVGQDKSFDIWVMKESVAEVTWNKIFSVGPFQMVDSVIGFWPSGNIIVLKQDPKQLMLYDFTTRETVHCELEFPTEPYMYEILVFSDSLVHVGGGVEC